MAPPELSVFLHLYFGHRGLLFKTATRLNFVFKYNMAPNEEETWSELMFMSKGQAQVHDSDPVQTLIIKDKI